MAYHIELRTKAIQAYEEGEGSQIEIASIFQISLSTFKRWLSMSRQGQPLQPMMENCGRPKKIDAAGEATIQSLVRNNPSITLNELSAAYYKKHKTRVGRSVLSRTLQKLNLRCKKLSIKSVKKETDKVQKKGEAYKSFIGNVPVKNLIFIDESGAHLQMTPRYGRAYGGERATVAAPYQHGNQLTMIGAISICIAVFPFKYPINSEIERLS